jgi:hypothetical protein
MACNRAALSEVDPDPTVMYWGRMADGRGAGRASLLLSSSRRFFSSPGCFPLVWYSWLMVMVGSSDCGRQRGLMGLLMMVVGSIKKKNSRLGGDYPRRYEVILAREKPIGEFAF